MKDSKKSKLLKELANRLKRIRAELSLTQEQFRLQLKNNTGFVLISSTHSNYEGGKNAPSFEFLEAMGRFGVSQNYLLNGSTPILKESIKGNGKKSIEEMWSELENGLKEEEFVYDAPVDFPGFHSEALTAPESFTKMLRYMIHDQEVKQKMLSQFFVMEKPFIDKKKSKL